MGAGVFRADFFSLLRSRVNFWGHQWFPFAFLWRVRFWLRMNAGGVLNTCKSNGIRRALPGGESGERVSNA